MLTLLGTQEPDNIGHGDHVRHRWPTSVGGILAIVQLGCSTQHYIPQTESDLQPKASTIW